MSTRAAFALSLSSLFILIAVIIYAGVHTSNMTAECAAKGGVWLARDSVCVRKDVVIP